MKICKDVTTRQAIVAAATFQRSRPLSKESSAEIAIKRHYVASYNIFIDILCGKCFFSTNKKNIVIGRLSFIFKNRINRFKIYALSR